MSYQAFVDETKEGGLLVTVAVLLPQDLAPARKVMRELCLPGQTRVHFTKESPSRRRRIAAAICRTGVQVDVYDATSQPDQHQARPACLRQIVADLACADARLLVLEQDDSLIKSDQEVLYDAVRRAGVAGTLTYRHLPPRSEPLLWIADAAAWCWTHRQEWRTRIEPVIRNVQSI